MLWSSHNTEGQICQDSSVSVVEIGTRLENQVLTFEFMAVFMALRRTALPFPYLLIFIKVETSHLLCFI